VRAGQHIDGGFVVLTEPTQRTAGLVRCGGCEKTMSNNHHARASHRATCEELQKLDKMAERASARLHR